MSAPSAAIPGERRLFPSLVVPLAVLGALGAALLLRPETGPGGAWLTLLGIPLPTVCTFKNLTGLPCAACGLTRSIVFLAHGRVSEAVALHPFGPLVAALALLAVPPRLALAVAGEAPWTRLWDRLWVRTALLLGVALLVWWLVTTGPGLLAIVRARLS